MLGNNNIPLFYSHIFINYCTFVSDRLQEIFKPNIHILDSVGNPKWFWFDLSFIVNKIKKIRQVGIQRFPG